jgi:predicted small metal-binding protein
MDVTSTLAAEGPHLLCLLGQAAAHRSAESEQELLSCVAEHADRDHGTEEIPADVVEQVKANVREVGAA